jgi:nucleoside-diphosphate-sugar epimerase
MPAREGDILYSLANVSKAKNVLGWSAKFSLDEGLKKTVASYDFVV